MYSNYLNICSYYNLEKVLKCPSPDASKTVEILYVGTKTWAGVRRCAPVLRVVFHIIKITNKLNYKKTINYPLVGF